MGRSILISPGNDEDLNNRGGIGFAYQTAVFECIVEGIRAHFQCNEQQCLKQCFEDLDELCMDYVCLYDVEPVCYNLFFHAAEVGLQQLKETGDVAIDRQVTEAFVSNIVREWEQLMIELRKDRRYRS